MVKPIFRPLQSHLSTINEIAGKKSAVPFNKNSFSQHLHNALGSGKQLSISKHAQERITQRGIVIDNGVWQKIEGKVQEAKSKGVSESLVLLKDAALIVSAKNNTVITAMKRKEAADQIFTNINGTIIID
ncbi:flagellar protein [Bacillus infantis]|uniref:TIGR02530 family flagellar biosynthesis protein n=1 Tax=Bacillus infantis TaxID=324767 RepID=UPI0020045530|nr:TIGR02530 family flagellar biosynthesis protein [Bacillus infantis]MCK6206205.1 flagellar protein [Bacillus infantis]